MATAEKILLGSGVVSIGATPIGLTRGGSVFTVDRKYRNIEADGDMGPVAGRVVIDSETAKLEVNALELFNSTNMTKYYPAMSVIADNETTPTKHTMTSTLTIVAGDYVDVKWVGKTKDGKAVTITVQNALNLDSLEWKLDDKSEVVPKLGFTAHYEEDSRTTPPWNVEYAA